MRLNINLATKPYQDVRRVLMQWGALVLLLAVFTVALAWTAVSTWRQSRDVNAKISVLKSEIAGLDRQNTEALAVLRLQQNSPVLENSKFLNGLIARKSFSWTRVFMQLEEIMPPRLHVVSISPKLQPNSNTVEVRLTVAGTSRQAAVEMVKRLEQSPSFRDARITEESEVRDIGSPDTVKFQVTARYVPSEKAQAKEPAESNIAVTKSKIAETRKGAR